MSIRVMSWVWEHSRAAGIDRLVLLAIADAANDDGAQAWPSGETLARKTGVNLRTVQRSMRRLVDLGEVSVKTNAGKNGANVYRVHMTTPTPGTVPPEPSLTRPKESLRDSSSSATPAARPDVERICTHLADRIEANGSKRPTITKAWRDSARLLLDRDGRTVEQVLTAIDWCQQDKFWRANVMSMPTLREQYDRLRLAAQRPRGQPANGYHAPTASERLAPTADLIARLEAKETASR